MRFHNDQHSEKGDSLVNELKQKVMKYSNLEDLPAEDLIEIAEKMGKYLKEKDLKTTQIRKFLDSVRKIDYQFNIGKSFNKEKVILLKPKLAYTAGREAKVKPLMEVLDPAITASSSSYESFKKLIALIEGIIAYHRYFGGRDS